MERNQIVVILSFLVRHVKNDTAAYREGIFQIPISTVVKFANRSSLLPDSDTVIDWMMAEEFICYYGRKDIRMDPTKLRTLCLKYNIDIAPANANVKAVKRSIKEKREEISIALRQHRKNVRIAQENLKAAITQERREAKRLEEAYLKRMNRPKPNKKEIIEAESNFIKMLDESNT